MKKKVYLYVRSKKSRVFEPIAVVIVERFHVGLWHEIGICIQCRTLFILNIETINKFQANYSLPEFPYPSDFTCKFMYIDASTRKYTLIKLNDG